MPGLLALAALGVALAGPVPRRAANRHWPVFVLVLAAGGALAYETLLYGHPEDLLATARRRRRRARRAPAAASTSPAVLLVGAVVAKQWAVLAILPAALAAPRAGAAHRR